eukprot:TRINITY_DN3031_c0_g1_i3.p1 TRINITY_DN3031_c0_g1~~TRINITY_DN3031_c0_g1_i3.p1  ORF type:complete len:180 (+),score=33.08 TRINITY_DN3031_c0_g1_i3:139-678(+)
MLQWAFVFSLLIFECLLCLTIILPIPFSYRRAFMMQLARIWNRFPRARIVSKAVMCLVFCLFLDSARAIYKVEQVKHDQPDINLKTITGQAPVLNIRLFASERNLFLTGFTLFLFIMLYRFMGMATQLMHLEESLATSGDKSADQKLQYSRLQVEVRQLQKTLDERGIVPGITVGDSNL